MVERMESVALLMLASSASAVDFTSAMEEVAKSFRFLLQGANPSRPSPVLPQHPVLSQQSPPWAFTCQQVHRILCTYAKEMQRKTLEDLSLVCYQISEGNVTMVIDQLNAPCHARGHMLRAAVLDHVRRGRAEHMRTFLRDALSPPQRLSACKRRGNCTKGTPRGALLVNTHDGAVAADELVHHLGVAGVPILTPSAREGYFEHVRPYATTVRRYVVVPDFDYISERGYIDRLKQLAGSRVPWGSKQLAVCFRGSSTGVVPSGSSDDILRENTRLALAMHARVRNTRTGSFGPRRGWDVGLSNTVQLSPLAAAAVRRLDLLRPEMSPQQFLRCRGIFDVDGNSNSWAGLAWKLASGSVVLKVVSPLMQWYYADLVPWVHYVPVANNLSDAHAHGKRDPSAGDALSVYTGGRPLVSDAKCPLASSRAVAFVLDRRNDEKLQSIARAASYFISNAASFNYNVVAERVGRWLQEVWGAAERGHHGR